MMLVMARSFKTLDGYEKPARSNRPPYTASRIRSGEPRSMAPYVGCWPRRYSRPLCERPNARAYCDPYLARAASLLNQAEVGEETTLPPVTSAVYPCG